MLTKLIALFLAFLTTFGQSHAPVPTTTTPTTAGPRIVRPVMRRHMATVPATTTTSTTTSTTTAPQAPAPESPDNYVFMSDKRWACQTIEWAVKTDGSKMDYGQAMADATAVFAQLHELTGFEFVHIDNFVDADINIDWRNFDWYLANQHRWGATSNSANDVNIVQSYISMSDITSEPLTTTVLRHELGHAMGLGHVDGAEVMNSDGASDYGPGDITGLKLAGAACQ